MSEKKNISYLLSMTHHTSAVSQVALRNESEIAHLSRSHVIAEALILKTTDMISKGASTKKIEQMLDLLDRVRK